MKKRRTMIISLLLVAALALGIGYAAQSGNVKVNGDVTNTPHELKLVFVKDDDVKITASSITGKDNGTTNSEIIVVDGAVAATFNVHDLAHKDDYVTAVFKVKNTNDYDVKLLTPTVTKTIVDDSLLPENADNFFNVEATYGNEDVGGNGDLILKKDETKTVTVKITMTVTTGNTLEGDFVVTIPATNAN
jgi:hypothetical protein